MCVCTSYVGIVIRLSDFNKARLSRPPDPRLARDLTKYLLTPTRATIRLTLPDALSTCAHM